MEKSSKRKYTELLIVAGFGLLFYCIHFSYQFNDFSDALFYFNDPVDAKVYAWNTWFFPHQLKNGGSVFNTDFICYPHGNSLWMHAYTLWIGAINFVLNDVELSINLGIAIQLIVAFVGFYYLAKRFQIHSVFAIAVAYFSVFNTYILAKSGLHYNLVLIGVVPFLMLLIISLSSNIKQKIPKLVGAFILLVVAFFMDYYMVFYVLSFLAIWMLWTMLLNKWFTNWQRKKWFAIAGVLVIGHAAVRLLRITGKPENGAIWGVGDVKMLVQHGVNKLFFDPVFLDTYNNHVYVGILFLIALLVSVFYFFRMYKTDKHARFLLFASILFLMISIPVIRTGAVWAGKNIFYQVTGLIHFIPFVNNVRAPDRFILMFTVMASAFIFRILTLSTTSCKIWLRPLVAFLFIVFGYIEHAHSNMIKIAEVPDSEVLVGVEGKPLLILPYGLRDGFKSKANFEPDHYALQRKYGFKMASGYLSRLSERTWDYAKNSELFRRLNELQDNDFVPTSDSEPLIEEIDLVQEMKAEKLEGIYINESTRSAYPKMHRYLKEEINAEYWEIIESSNKAETLYLLK